MNVRWRRYGVGAAPVAVAVLATAVLVGGGGAGAAPAGAGAVRLSPAMTARMSETLLLRYYQAYPDRAPDDVRRLLALGRDSAATATAATGAPATGPTLFTRDDTGLTQDQESVARCAGRPGVILQSANDFRSMLDPAQNFTGWYLSTDGGRSVANEGRLSATTFPSGTAVESDGNAAVAADDACTLYLATIATDRINFFVDNGVVVATSTPEALAACPGQADPSCWRTRKVVVAADGASFIDRPRIAVGTAQGRTVVWVSYIRSLVDPDTGAGVTRAEVVRCDAALTDCSAPIPVAKPAAPDEFSDGTDVTVGPDGGTYVSWADFSPGKTAFGETATIRMRAAPPGSTEFGPASVVAVEKLPIVHRGALASNTFRSVTLPQSDVKLVGGRPRAYVVWEGCTAQVRDGQVCEGAHVNLRWADGVLGGRPRWSATHRLSAPGGSSYFPTISANPGGAGLAVAWYTSRYDPVYDNRQDVELATVDTDGTARGIQRLTPVSNAPEADPTYLGIYIGNYFEVTARGDSAVVAFNASFRRLKLLGAGIPIPQQDNYLAAAQL